MIAIIPTSISDVSESGSLPLAFKKLTLAFGGGGEETQFWHQRAIPYLKCAARRPSRAKGGGEEEGDTASFVHFLFGLDISAYDYFPVMKMKCQ